MSIVFLVDDPVDETYASRPLAASMERLGEMAMGQIAPCAWAARRRNIAAVPHITFTPQLRRFTATPELHSRAGRLRELLDEAFAVNPQLRGYVLDEQGHLRANVVVFIDGRRSQDRISQSEPLQPHSRVFVMQALSGG